MKEEVKNIMIPLINQINVLKDEVKNNNIDIDTLVKVETLMKMTSVRLNKVIKENKHKISGSVSKTSEEE